MRESEHVGEELSIDQRCERDIADCRRKRSPDGTQIAFTMAVVVNCLGMVISNRARMTIPTGLDEENILTINIQSRGEAFGEAAFLQVSWPIAATVWAAEKWIPRLYRETPFLTISESSRDDLIERVRPENRRRWAKYGESVFLLEPHVKEGKGGLRDLHWLLWIGRVPSGQRCGSRSESGSSAA